MKDTQKGLQENCPAVNNCVGGQGMDVKASFHGLKKKKKKDERELPDHIRASGHVQETNFLTQRD